MEHQHFSSDMKFNIAGTNSRYTPEDFKKLYDESVKDPSGFWLRLADEKLDWIKKPTVGGNFDFSKENLSIKWFEDGQLNVCYNCVDRHAEKTPDKIALTWEADDINAASVRYTFAQLKSAVAKFAAGLKSIGVKKGDRVTIYMPMVPEAAMSMLACARIGAIHNVVFGGFSVDSLAMRIKNCDSEYVITANEGMRGGKTVPLKANVDDAVSQCPTVKKVVTVKATDLESPMSDKDIWYHDMIADVSDDCPCEPMNAEDPLFILYTSGSTGQPKGLLHTTGGYLLYAQTTFETTFDYRDGEVFWCTADVGWITGHSYLVYGPLSAGANTVVFEGVPTYPDASRFWNVVEKHKINIFYTAPTAIRSLLAKGDEFTKQSDLSSLRILGTVGEPINVEAWEWYHKEIGGEKCPIVDTWWQTETGGHMVTPVPHLWPLKPSKATLPAFGVQPAFLDEKQNEVPDAGAFCMKASWPGQARSIYGDHARFYDAYFSQYPGYYFTGDGAEMDEDGYIRITGRMDDVLNVSGHRMATAEIEDALDEHEHIAETAVVGFPHSVKGEGIYAYCILKEGHDANQDIETELRNHVRKVIGPIASPDVIQITPDLPKTRSGKIMRRILRKIAHNDFGELGDISTLANPDVVEKIIEGRKPTE